MDTYNIIVDGMTQDDRLFRDAILELGTRAEFYTLKTQALNRFNQAIVGNTELEREIDLVGMVDFDANHLLVHDQVLPLDGLDPQYVEYLQTAAMVSGKMSKRIPLTQLAFELLDEQVDVEAKPEIEREILPAAETTSLDTQKVLRQAFNNEMLLLVQLDDYVKKNNLESVVEANKDDLIHLVGSHAYDFRFKDAVEELQTEVLEVGLEH